MANRRGTDGTSSPSLDGNNRTNFAPACVNDQSRDNNVRGTDESDHTTGRPETSRETRREENPFSFKHFLRKDSRPNYNLSGARPKVYSPARAGPSAAAADAEGIYPCNPTELPDFVQDHLLIEQCYLDQDSAGVPPVADADNLPDFAISHSGRRAKGSNGNRTTSGPTTRARNEPAESIGEARVARNLPFDLTGGLERRNPNNSVSCNVSAAAAAAVVHDLPVYPRPNQLPVRQAEATARNAHQQNIPFDLPPSSARDSSSAQSNPTGPANSPASEAAGVSKTLPDFLNDGPIRNRVAGSNNENDASLDMPERPDASHLALENERLRDELKTTRRHITDKVMMIESLKAELASRRAVDQDETAHLEKAMEQVEVNLKRSTKRATNAESAVTLLKQQVKALIAEVSSLRSENRELRSIAGAGGADCRLPGTDRRIKEFSAELRTAATSAELSLRQLMSGVNNLKAMASALENVDRTEERTTKDFLSDFEEENAAGPAL